MTAYPIHKEGINIFSRTHHLIATCETYWKLCEVLRHFLRQVVFCSTKLRAAVFREVSKYCEIILSVLCL